MSTSWAQGGQTQTCFVFVSRTGGVHRQSERPHSLTTFSITVQYFAGTSTRHHVSPGFACGGMSAGGTAPACGEHAGAHGAAGGAQGAAGGAQGAGVSHGADGAHGHGV